MRKYNRSIWSIAVVLAIIAAVPAVAIASRGFYPLDSAVRSGMLVSLTKNSDTVEPATDENMKSLVGVVGVSEADYSVQPGQVSVQTDGVVNTLVSTVDGDIRVGDHISPTMVVGLGGKSDGNSWIVGTAQASLDASTSGAVKTKVTDTADNEHEVYVATIPVLVKVMQENTSSQAASKEQTAKLPTKVQSFADSVAGKRASQVAVILSFFIVLAGLVISGIIVNAAVRNGITSTARQPLAKQAITFRMTQAIIVAITILVLAVVSSLVIIRVL